MGVGGCVLVRMGLDAERFVVVTNARGKKKVIENDDRALARWRKRGFEMTEEDEAIAAKGSAEAKAKRQRSNREKKRKEDEAAKAAAHHAAQHADCDGLDPHEELSPEEKKAKKKAEAAEQRKQKRQAAKDAEAAEKEQAEMEAADKEATAAADDPSVIEDEQPDLPGQQTEPANKRQGRNNRNQR